MKTVALFIAGFLSFSGALAQINYHLQVFDNQHKPLSGMTVRLVEAKSFERIELKTNASGVLDYTFDHGELWIGSVGEMNNCLWIETKGRGNSSKTLTYDLKVWERENRILPDRNSIVFKQTPQKYASMPMPDQTHCALTVNLKDRNNTPQAGIPITITCFKLAEQFTATTNATGACVFLLPNNNDYEIDVADIPSLDWIDFGNESAMQSTTITYEKKNFTEKKAGNYVIQTIPQTSQPTSTHARVTLTVKRD